MTRFSQQASVRGPTFQRAKMLTRLPVVVDYLNNAPPVKLSDWAKLPSKGFKSLKERTRSIVPDNVPEISMRLLEGLCAQTQGLIHATGEYMDHCFLPQSHALPARELEMMEAYEAHSPCNMETLFWGRTDPISGNIEPKMAVVVLAPWTFKSGHLVEFQHGASVSLHRTRVVPMLINVAEG